MAGDVESALKSQIKDVLNEARILVLATQVLLGFQYQAIFIPGFQRLTAAGQWGSLFCLVLELVVIALLLAPAPYHRIVENGDDTVDLKHLTAKLIGIALPLLALALGLNLSIVSAPHLGGPAGILVGALVIVSAFVLWIIIGMANRTASNPDSTRRRVTKLQEKIETLLTETRVILPGVQALLGFQFSAVLTDRFDKLPSSLQAVHLTSLVLMALSIVLLIAPAAYHRLAADGEARADVDTFGARAVLAALAPLAIGLSGDLFIVVAMQAHSAVWGGAAAFAALTVFVCFWAILPAAGRRRRKKHEKA